MTTLINKPKPKIAWMIVVVFIAATTPYQTFGFKSMISSGVKSTIIRSSGSSPKTTTGKKTVSSPSRTSSTNRTTSSSSKNIVSGKNFSISTSQIANQTKKEIETAARRSEANRLREIERSTDLERLKRLEFGAKEADRLRQIDANNRRLETINLERERISSEDLLRPTINLNPTINSDFSNTNLNRNTNPNTSEQNNLPGPGFSTDLISNFKPVEKTKPDIPKYEVITHESKDYQGARYESEINRHSRTEEIKEIIKLKGMNHLRNDMIKAYILNQRNNSIAESSEEESNSKDPRKFPPGLSKRPPGLSNLPPGLSKRPPGLSNLPPGLSKRPPDLGNLPPGLSKRPPVLSNLPPGVSKRPFDLSINLSDTLRRAREEAATKDRDKPKSPSFSIKGPFSSRDSFETSIKQPSIKLPGISNGSKFPNSFGSSRSSNSSGSFSTSRSPSSFSTPKSPSSFTSSSTTSSNFGTTTNNLSRSGSSFTNFGTSTVQPVGNIIDNGVKNSLQNQVHAPSSMGGFGF